MPGIKISSHTLINQRLLLQMAPVLPECRHFFGSLSSVLPPSIKILTRRQENAPRRYKEVLFGGKARLLFTVGTKLIALSRTEVALCE